MTSHPVAPPRPVEAAPESVECCPASGVGDLAVEQAVSVATVFKALSDPVRLRLYSRIASADDEVCVCDIDDVGVSQPTVSHHLRRLREAGLIDCERRGSWVYYRAVPGATHEAGHLLDPR